DYINGVMPHYEAQYRMRADENEWRWVISRARVVEWTVDQRPMRVYGTLIDIHQHRLNEIALDEERQMLTTGPVVMARVRLTRDAPRFVSVSSNVATLWGYQPDTLVALPSSLDIVHPDDLLALKDDFWRAMKNEEDRPIDVELRLRMADGQYRWFRYSTLVDPSLGERKGYFIDIDARKQAELETATQRQRLQETILQLEAAHGEGGVLQDTSDMLHATEGLDEAFGIIKLSALRLFPGWSGWVAASRDGSNELKVGAQWGKTHDSLDVQFNGRDCWGMRRGKPHAFFNMGNSVCCPHLRSVPPSQLRPYLCVPMAAHGETVGALHLFCDGPEPSERQMQDAQSRASRFAETLKLALSNLKLRTSLHDQAMKDGLTGLYNRRYMDEVLAHELQRARREHKPVSLAMFDVDHFKRFNDDFGHDAGDAVLRAISAVLQESIRGYDIACRYGGEELALILPSCEVHDAAMRIEQVRSAVERMQIRHEGVDLPRVTISVGLSHATGGNPTALIRRADEALYDAKRAGRNRVVISQASVLALAPQADAAEGIALRR
ncbi:MAG: diguanylate cyclase, partial [Rubrivivax sp.]